MLEVAEFLVQVLGLDALEGVGAGGVDDGRDVPGVELAEALGQPRRRVGGDELKVAGQVVQV